MQGEGTRALNSHKAIIMAKIKEYKQRDREGEKRLTTIFKQTTRTTTIINTHKT